MAFAEYISAPLKKGHKVYALNLSTKTIEEVNDTIDQLGNGTIVTVRQIPGHLYCTALNVINADKKFIRMLGLQDKIKYIKHDNTARKQDSDSAGKRGGKKD